jgi:large-conductance mechanosensitive channel MscL
MRGDVITVAVGLVVALAFSNLVKAFTDSVINPLVAAAQPHTAYGLGVQLGNAGNMKPLSTLARSFRRLSTSSSYGGRVLRHRGALQADPEAQWGHGVRGRADDQGVQRVLVRHSRGRAQVQVLRERAADLRVKPTTRFQRVRERGGPVPSIDAADALLDERHELHLKTPRMCARPVRLRQRGECLIVSLKDHGVWRGRGEGAPHSVVQF